MIFEPAVKDTSRQSIYSKMKLHSVIITNTWLARNQRSIFSTFFRLYSGSAELLPPIYPRTSTNINKACKDFLSWLEHKAGEKISSALAVGNSSYGRTLYAAEDIQTGDRILKVPFSVQLAPDNLPPEISSLLGREVGNVAKVALLILHEKILGTNSEWAPYINSLPWPDDLHSTIFWGDEELEMIRPSALYRETLGQKSQIGKDFSEVKFAFSRFPNHFRDVTLQEFSYAYGLVTSRAWGSSRGVSMVPFADFLNHDGASKAYVVSDESERYSEVIADRCFAPGDDVRINYGKFSNSTLMLDFGFTVCSNGYDQVSVELNVPRDDVLYEKKLEILDRHRTPRVRDVNEFISKRNSFTLGKVKNGSEKGKGIPQSLRAFCRVLTCNSEQELNVLAFEAERNDGRLARCPLKDKNREIAAHRFLLSEVSRVIDGHDRHMGLLVSDPPRLCEKSVVRRRLARDLFAGELRVLKSAAEWLENYCSTLYR